MRLTDEIISALNLYSPEQREWSDERNAVAAVLTDVASRNRLSPESTAPASKRPQGPLAGEHLLVTPAGIG
ncbi:MAG TPA: hypothetical protein VF391_01040 [Dermatophilaceae bacterium]|jgi:hypothetical protein